MKLSNLNKNIKVTVVKVNCADELRQRFYSFGIIKGASIIIEEVSLTKNTITLVVDDTNIAIRVEEAQKIEVELV